MSNTGLSNDARETVSDALNKLLANEFLLYTKTWKFHWNVEGKHFDALHKFFQGQFEQLAIFVDDTAERVRALDHIAIGTLQEFLDQGAITDKPGNNPDELGMVKELLAGHETIIQQVRKDITLTEKLNDMGSNNFLADLLEKHEKMAWMLRAFLK